MNRSKKVKWMFKNKRDLSIVTCIFVVSLQVSAAGLSEQDLVKQSQKANELVESLKRQSSLVAQLEADLTFQKNQINTLYKSINDKESEHDVRLIELEAEYADLIAEADANNEKELAPKKKSQETYQALIAQDPALATRLSEIFKEITAIQKQHDANVREIKSELAKEKQQEVSRYESESDGLKQELKAKSAVAQELAVKVNTEKSAERRLKSESEIELDRKDKLYRALANQLAQEDYEKYEGALTGVKEVTVNHRKPCGDDITPNECKRRATDEAKQKAVEQGADIIVSSLSEIEINSTRGVNGAINESAFTQRSEIRNNGNIVNWNAEVRTRMVGDSSFEAFVKGTAQVNSVANTNMRKIFFQSQLDKLQPLLSSTAVLVPKVVREKPRPTPVALTKSKPIQQKTAPQKPKEQKSFGNDKVATRDDKSLEQEMAEERAKLAAIRRKQQEEAKANEDDGWGIGTWSLIGLGVAGGAAAAAGGGEEKPDPDPDPETDYTGTYTIDISGSRVSSVVGNCSASASIQLSNVTVTHIGTSFSIPDLGMTGSISSGTFSISSGQHSVIGIEGFQSTDEIRWGSFSGSFSGDNDFSANDVTLDTFENGIHECEYRINMNGSK